MFPVGGFPISRFPVSRVSHGGCYAGCEWGLEGCIVSLIMRKWTIELAGLHLSHWANLLTKFKVLIRVSTTGECIEIWISGFTPIGVALCKFGQHRTLNLIVCGSYYRALLLPRLIALVAWWSEDTLHMGPVVSVSLQIIHVLWRTLGGQSRSALPLHISVWLWPLNALLVVAWGRTYP